jgi:hypothetical protein
LESTVGLIADAIRVVGLSLSGLLLLAVVHKARVLAAGAARDQPLMQLGRLRRRHAPSLLALAAAVESVVAVVLILFPPVGLAAILALLGPYTWELRHIRADQPCNCLGNSLGATRVAAIRRNVVLAALAAAALVPVVAGSTRVGPISQATVGTALLVLAAAVPSVSLIQFVEPATKAHLRGSGARPATRGGRVAT